MRAILKKYLKRRWPLWIVCGVSVLVIMLFMWNIKSCGLFHDFNTAYYPAGRSVMRCLLLKEDLSGLHEIYDSFSKDKAAGFVNIPIIALLFPFAIFNKTAAGVLMFILGLAAILAACICLINLTTIRGREEITLFGIFVINGPLYYSLREGNLTHFVFLFLVIVVFFLQKKRDVAAGIILAVAALIKLPLLLFVVYYFIRGRWRVVAGFCTTLLAIVGASVLLFGVDLHLTWFRLTIQVTAGKSLASFNVQCIDGFLTRLLTGHSLSSWIFFQTSWAFLVLRYTLILSLVGVVAWTFLRSKPPATQEEEYSEFSTVLCLSLLISPISWTHYYLFLLLPFSLYIGHKLAIPKGRIWSILMSLSLLFISLPVLPRGSPILTHTSLLSKLFISHYFFGGVLLLGILLAAQRQKRYHNVHIRSGR